MRPVSPKKGIKVSARRCYMRRPSVAQAVDADMALSILIVVLIAAIATALVGWGTPPLFIPLDKGGDDSRRRSEMGRNK